jgi:membrane protein DedA with SNARE-associated domain
VEFISEIINQLFHWIQSLGYFGIMLGLMVEVIPSEIVLAYGGYLVYMGDINFFGAVLFGTIGGVIAQLFVYWIGRYGGRPVLEKYGKYILIHKKQIDASEAWFEKYGTGVIFTARFIPVVRHAISIPAGISRMNLGKFTILTTLAVIPWSILFVYLGYYLGAKWETIDEVAGPYIMPIILTALALLIVYFLMKWIKSSKRGIKS